MFGRLARILLVAAMNEVGGALIHAGRRWVERKLSPPPVVPAEPVSSKPAPEAD